MSRQTLEIELNDIQLEIDKNIKESRSDIEFEQLLIKRERLRRSL